MKKITTYLIVIAAIMLLSFGAKAQGGLAPLVGSTHVYTIEPESTSNTLTWSIVEISGYTINSQIIVGENSVANITWTAAGTYKLQFTELNETTDCATIKELEITVSANTFDVSTSNPTEVCNAADGQINYAAADATTEITFTVDMTTANATFSPNWEITFTLTPGIATLANVKAGANSLTPDAGVYTATGLTSTDGDGTVNITMDVTGGVYAAQNVVLTLTSAKELTYNTPDKDSDDWTTTQTINAIPQTSTILTD